MANRKKRANAKCSVCGWFEGYHHINCGTTKKLAGRRPSPEGRVRLDTTIPPYVKRWLVAQKGGISAAVTRLVDAQGADKS